MIVQQVWVDRPGGAEVLLLRETEVIAPSANEVCIQVEAAGVTRADTIVRQGKPHPGSPRIPLALGFEIVGRITQVGAEVSALNVGQRVIAVVHSGGYATYCCVEAWRCIPISETLDAASAVALVINYWTAWVVLHRRGRVQTGQSVLLHGVSGGVGTALAQLGQLAELRMAGTASADKHEQVRDLGVLPIDYRNEDFVARTKEWTHGQGVDLIVDPIGGDHWVQSYRALAKGGRLLLTGIQSLTDKPMIYLLPSALRILFLALLPDEKSVRFVGLIPENMKDIYREDLTQLIAYLSEGVLQPIISKQFPLSQAADAHRYLESGKAFGKVVLVPD